MQLSSLNRSAMSSPVVLKRSSVVASAQMTISRRQAVTASVIGICTLLPRPSQADSVCNMAGSEELAKECRESVLSSDNSTRDSYGKAQSRSSAGPPASLVPVADLNDAYVRDTKDLIHHIKDFTAIEITSKGRPPLIKEIKTDGLAWVSKYARGGSARTLSARKMYIAVDSIIGHFSANGLAPLPAAKSRTILATLDLVSGYLKEGK